MITDSRVERLATVILDYSTHVTAGDLVVIRGHSLGEPLLMALYRGCLQRGAFPHLDVWLPDQDETFCRLASDGQLDRVSPIVRQYFEQFDVMIRVDAEANTKARTSIEAGKQSRYETAYRSVTERYLERSAAGEFRWCRTLFPTQAYAQDSEMSLSEFEDFVFRACLVDGDEDPARRWRELAQRQQRWVEWLKGRHEVHLLGPGTDLRLSVQGRPFISCHGETNMPDGELFVAPAENAVHGHVSFTYPACYRGREVEGVQLRFEDGRVVKACAGKNEELLHKMLDTDEGARRLGEFAFGCNPGVRRFTRNILFDEKMDGTVHMALGFAYPESGGSNTSAIHWDMVCDLRDGGRVTVDGDLFARDGQIVV